MGKEKNQFFMCEADVAVCGSDSDGKIVYGNIHVARIFDARSIRSAYNNLHESVKDCAEKRGFLFNDGCYFKYQSGSIRKRIL